jgi:hypothetical protein
MRKINIWAIIVNHISTLRDYSTQKYSVQDLVLFLGAPLAASSAGLYFKWSFSVNALNALLAAFSIFAGLLLNLLLLVYTFSSEGIQPNALAKVKTQFVRELQDNIAFSVLISVFIVVFALAAIMRVKADNSINSDWIEISITSVVLYFMSNFLLTLLMILKRIHAMLNERLERPPMRKAS